MLKQYKIFILIVLPGIIGYWLSKLVFNLWLPHARMHEGVKQISFAYL